MAKNDKELLQKAIAIISHEIFLIGNCPWESERWPYLEKAKLRLTKAIELMHKAKEVSKNKMMP